MIVRSKCLIIVVELAEWLRAIKWRAESIIKYSKAQFNRHTEEMESRTTTSDIVVQPSRVFRARTHECLVWVSL